MAKKEKTQKRAEHRGEDWPGAKVYLPPEAYRLVWLISASEGTSRSRVMMLIITNYLAGVTPERLLQKFRTLGEPTLKAPPRRPGPPTSTVKIGHPAQQIPQKISLTRLATEDEQEA